MAEPVSTGIAGEVVVGAIISGAASLFGRGRSKGAIEARIADLKRVLDPAGRGYQASKVAGRTRNLERLVTEQNKRLGIKGDAGPIKPPPPYEYKPPPPGTPSPPRPPAEPPFRAGGTNKPPPFGGMGDKIGKFGKYGKFPKLPGKAGDLVNLIIITMGAYEIFTGVGEELVKEAEDELKRSKQTADKAVKALGDREKQLDREAKAEIARQDREAADKRADADRRERERVRLAEKADRERVRLAEKADREAEAAAKRARIAERKAVEAANKALKPPKPPPKPPLIDPTYLLLADLVLKAFQVRQSGRQRGGFNFVNEPPLFELPPAPNLGLGFLPGGNFAPGGEAATETAQETCYQVCRKVRRRRRKRSAPRRCLTPSSLAAIRGAATRRGRAGG